MSSHDPKQCEDTRVRALPPPGLSDADRASLTRLARRGDRLSLRARGILLLADGTSQAGVARALHVAVSTVRAWRRRWRAGGIEALGPRPRGRPCAAAPTRVFATLPATLPPVEAALLRGKPSGPGRPALARTAIEAWIRDAAALGLLAPGSRLPDREWLSRRFRASAHTLAAAMSSLARQGFVRNLPRVGSFLAPSLPFENRYLMLLSASDQGLDRALAAAARAQELRRGTRWTIASGLTRQGPVLGGIPADIAAHRWAGVFLRTSPSEPQPGWEFLSLDRVPMSGFLGPGPWLGAQAVPLHGGSAPDYRLDESSVFAAVRRARRRRMLVIDAIGRSCDAFGCAEEMRRVADAFGLCIPPSCYQLLDPSFPEQAQLILSAVLRLAPQERIDTVAVLQDNFVEPVCRGLVETFGADRAASVFVAACGHRPLLQRACLPVEWHGQDLARTLDSFTDWCDALHAGAKAPPPPELALF